MTNLGTKNYVAGWCFDGWAEAKHLKRVLLDTSEFLGLTPIDEPVVLEFSTGSSTKWSRITNYFNKKLPAKSVEVVVILYDSEIMGSSRRYIMDDKVEFRVRILLSSFERFDPYEVGKFIKTRLAIPMISKGYFIY